MKQILQDLQNGKTELVEVPKPRTKSGHLYIQSSTSLISAGTERMLIDFGKGNYLQKARQQPEKVKEVLDKVRTDGLMPTVEAVRSKLGAPLPLGYCNVGRVEDPATSFKGQVLSFKKNDRVASNGPHAEYVCVPKNLCAKVPDNVSDEEAAFTVIGAIALQGVRLAEPTLGEYFVVTGLGLVGLMTVQILSANGCSVLGIDFDPDKCRLAERFGAKAVCLGQGEDPLRVADGFSKGRGVDGVIICAATKSNDPIRQATEMCRRKGRIVLTGVTGLELSRDLFFKKELSFQVSCSYGPGRYDPEYEDKGKDYPFEFVRWTEQRNFEAVLDLMAAGKLDVKPLISHRFVFENAEDAYRMIADNSEPYVGIILDYQSSEGGGRKTEGGGWTVQLRSSQTSDLRSPTSAVVGMIGAGGYTGQVLLPAMGKGSDVRFKTIASGTGVSGTHLGKKFGFEQSTTDTEALLSDPEINTVFVTTRHNTHYRFVMQALEAGKHVFVEKPLCMNREELDDISNAYADRGSLTSNHRPPILMLGFNRRFAPLIQQMQQALGAMSGPKSMIMTVNAGEIPLEHWTQDPQVGGGRIIGEACHFIDLLRYLAGAHITGYDKTVMQSAGGDTLTITLRFADGSIGAVHYFANGSKMFPKERLEVFCEGKILQMNNFRTLKGYGFPRKGRGGNKRLWRQDKGQQAEMQAFFAAIREGQASPIPFEEITEVMRVTLALA
ncbi:bi-domain-containing oxidoreductase [Desulfohalobium retbaense]|uniref:Oxidoreductase domain protein n=1 Tax=Desulfohalobium retbaense (strain ATCC 49708 / DSM 5692 / JCM 16813 / HR100) TaxID=485915 RepID=C8X063_DESRD|nr:bi-domain-containing oxidoreductase [Desulfohalobium retbaense]ACV67688.1 oxidoreductase domain protein [Desulfohalobium retbaense DSM 5692]